jgi:hypothetical protein
MVGLVLAVLLGLVGGGAARADGDAPRLGFPSPPRFEAHADQRTVDVSWAGSSAQVVTVVRGGEHTRERRFVVHPTHVEVRDTLRNPAGDMIGLRIRHAVVARSGDVYAGGRPAPDGADAYNPWNPTVFVPTAGGGVGLVAEDDVLRNQLWVDNDRKSGTAGLRTDTLCLGAGDQVTLVWSVYPTATASYWDFINTVRADWGVNRTVSGSYIWFSPDGILGMDPDRLRAGLERQRVGVANLNGGWIDPHRPESPPLIAYGTFVMSQEFASYRERVRAAVAKLKAARPSLRVLLYFDVQRDSSPDAPARFPDSLLIGRGNRADFFDWAGKYSGAWSMVPTTDNAFGTAMAKVPGEMRALGADGLYWDEIDAVDFSKPRVTEAAWDRRTCRLGPDGSIEKPVGLANLLSESAKLDYARAGAFVLGNGPPTTRRFQDRADTRMIEAQHNDTWGAFAHLTTPLGYISVRTDWGTVLDKIDEGLLVAGIPLEYPHDIVPRLFPFTPEYIQPGTLRGRERIVTTRSGLHGWEAATGPLRLYHYDASGKEHEAEWHVEQQNGGIHVRVELGPREAAVIERTISP